MITFIGRKEVVCLIVFGSFNAELTEDHPIFKYTQVQFFAYTQLNVKTVLLQTIQFSISTQFKCQNSSISNNSV